MKRRQAGDKMLDDDALERQLALEFNSASSAGGSGDDDDDEGEDGDGLDRGRGRGRGKEDEDEEDADFDDDDDDEDFGFDEDDELYDGPDLEELLEARGSGRALSQTSSDVIEVYDEEGNLVGTYSDAEFDELRKKGKVR